MGWGFVLPFGFWPGFVPVAVLAGLFAAGSGF
jgi:hypothetical protein